MAWSTRELADLAGTTVNTVRHYHRLGLLEVPERGTNGYKQYRVRDLVRLLQIRRLVDLGVPLSKIDAFSETDETTPDALRQLDAELAETIERLQRARADIASILESSGPVDAPAGFEAVASRLSKPDSSIIHIYAQLYDESAIDDLREMVEADTGEFDEFDVLTEDADDATRQRLAEQMAPTLVQNLVDYPWLAEPASRSKKSEQVTQDTFVRAMLELYNLAQIDVLQRAALIARPDLHPDAAGADAAG